MGLAAQSQFEPAARAAAEAGLASVEAAKSAAREAREAREAFYLQLYDTGTRLADGYLESNRIAAIVLSALLIGRQRRHVRDGSPQLHLVVLRKI